MDKREAREVLDLAELVAYSLDHGPVPLERYARIRRCSGKLESHERNARALVARLRGLGYLLVTEGDAERLTVDFGKDEALRAEIERSRDEASRAVGLGEPDEGDGNDSPHLAGSALVQALARDYRAGLTVGSLVSRYGLRTERALLILQAVGDRRRPGRRRIEEARCAELLRKALADPVGVHGHVTRVARLLACDRKTARALLKRLERCDSTRR